MPANANQDVMERIRLQVMWDRLLSVVEEQAQTLVRTAFSTSTREAGDVSAGVFDLDGKMLAQAVTGTPGHINSMARAVVHFIREFPVDTMSEGDSYITNDPWMGTGHLHDLTVVSPCYKDGKMVALFACTSHLVDIGGIGQSPDGRQVYHEGLYIPLLPLMRKGVMEEWLLKLVRANVREPIQVEGDIYALAACNETGATRLLAMMAEYGLNNLDALGHHIITESRQGMADAINKMPKGTWTASMRIDGYETPIDLVATLTIGDGEILVDFDGSSGVVDRGINCPMCYTEAYTSFGVKCVAAPNIPNNAGTLDAIIVTAPENTIVNAPHPAAVVARSTIGHMLPDVVFGCIDQAMPGVVPAEGTSNLWTVKLGAGHGMGTAVHGEFLPFRWCRRTARAGRIVRNTLPKRRAQCAGGGDGSDHAHCGVAEGIPHGFWRRWQASRWPWPGDGGREPGRRTLRHFRYIRTRPLSAARAGRWWQWGQWAAQSR